MDRRTFLRTIAAAGAAAIATPAAKAAGKPATHTVVISDFVFTPETLTVRPGDRIRWINRDIVPHTATATDESWDTGEIAAGKSTETQVIDGMMETYFCRFHPSMKAILAFA
ncbi:MAG: plastocyanin/azurin family copper-binding protein [Rhodospirillaceae bacterium]|nr:plastocyanin/azurin family copper-binding protein [Rhodospirillaceae bacterium]MDD9918892.1 plastocyanin/azurin family copper-binding protein [Rhodospirillaceae bacterium]MDD9926210.1 plastocyanin/azurin family copper-binding protein [Rhodospirillaceae bacterium]